MTDPLVSVVVTTKNSEADIGRCLESIKLQSYSREAIEMIVVDNASTDRTKEIARRYTPHVFDRGPERSAQRNFGILEKSRGQYVLYLDVDMILSSSVVAEAVRQFEDHEVLAFYVSELVLGGSFWSQVRRFERSFYDGTVIDCVRFLRRDVFVRVGGFDLALTGQEDWDLDKKVRQLGRVAVLGDDHFEETQQRLRGVDYQAGNLAEVLSDLSPAPVVYHNEINFDLLKYLGKKGYYLERFPNYIKKWGGDDPDIRRQTSIFYRLVGVFTEDGKWRRLLAHPGLAAGMYFLRFLVAGCFLWSRLRQR